MRLAFPMFRIQKRTMTGEMTQGRPDNSDSQVVIATAGSLTELPPALCRRCAAVQDFGKGLCIDIAARANHCGAFSSILFALANEAR